MESDSDAPTAVQGGEPTRAEPGAGTLPEGRAALPDGLSLGERVGRYVILDRVGEGGMGVVYAAYDPELDRRVALKLLHAAGGSTHAGEEHARLLREAQALARVSHGNIVRVHDVGTVDDRVFVAMDFVRGQTLRQWLAAGPHQWPEVVAVLAEAGRGLAAAHDAGLVHRDFKPGNVMLDDDGHVHVLDFGLARMGDDERRRPRPAAPNDSVRSTDRLTAAITEAGTVLGTPAYMAPEQHAGGEVDGRADQFAFCVALWEGVHGERPFSGASVDDLVSAVMRHEVRPPARDVPAWLHRALLRGLQREPGRRHPDMRTLLEVLEETPRRRRRRAMIVTIAALITVSVGGSYAYARHRQATVCAGSAAAVQEVWNADVRGRVREALRADPRPWTAAAVEPVVQRLDAHAVSLVDAGHEACADTELRGEQSAAARERRETCLAGQREHLRVLAERLSAGGAEVVLNAAAAAWALPGPYLCRGDVAGAREDPSIVEARVAGLLGDGAAVDRALTDAEERAGINGDTTGLARARLARARVGGGVGVARAAAQLAERAGLDGVAARAWLVRLDREREARPQVDALAAAAIDRAGAPPDLVMELARVRGDRARDAGDTDAAVEHHREALAGAEALHGVTSLEAARGHRRLGELELTRGRVDRAVSRHLRAVALAQEVLGPDHPHTAPFLEGLGEAMIEQGQTEEGERYRARARRIRAGEASP